MMKGRLLRVSMGLWLAIAGQMTSAQTTIIRTVAGGGPDGAPGPQASFSQPGAIAIGQDGTIYFTSRGSHRVFALDRSGEIRPVAGSGVKAYGGDGGPALLASLNDPYGLAVDAAGNLYISDSENSRIRRVDAVTGIITTLAGTGLFGFGGDGGPAASARLARPYGLALDVNGHLYVADSGNNVIRRISTDGVITTVAGNNRGGFAGDGGPAASASLNSPFGVAFDPGGAMYIADRANHRIRRVAPDGTISTWMGNGSSSFGGDGGPAAQARIGEPQAIAFDTAGNAYIAETANRRVRRVAANGGTVSTLAGNGNISPIADGGPATTPVTAIGVAVDALGNVYIADNQNHRLRRVDASQRISTVAGNGQPAYSGDNGEATRAVLNGPTGLATDGKSLFIADTENHRIRRLDLETGRISLYAGNGDARFSGDNGPATAASLNRPIGLSLDPQGNLYFADYRNHRIRRVTPAGTISTVAGNGSTGTAPDSGVMATQAALYDPIDVSADRSGNFYIADRYNYKIRKVTPDGRMETIAGAGSSGATPADGSSAKDSRFGYPVSVLAGADGSVYFSDSGNRRVLRITDGKLYSAAGGGGSQSNIGDGGPATSAYLGAPQLLAFGAGESLLISDSFGHRIRERGGDGVMRSVAGTGAAGFSGDGSTATSRQLNAPAGVAFVAPCSVYIADTANNRVRRVRPLLAHSINTVPAGLQLTVDDETGVAAIERQWEALTIHTISAPSPQETGEGVRHLGPETQFVTVPCGPERQELNIGFQTQYRLTVESTEGGKLDVETGWHNAGAEVKVTPTPEEGFVFQGWEGACAEKEADQCVIGMDAPKSVKALFAKPE